MVATVLDAGLLLVVDMAFDALLYSTIRTITIRLHSVTLIASGIGEIFVSWAEGKSASGAASQMTGMSSAVSEGCDNTVIDAVVVWYRTWKSMIKRVTVAVLYK